MSLTLKLLSILPRKALSHFVGQVVHLEKPIWFSACLKKILISSLKIDTSEAEKPVDQYPSFGAFFSRKLKAGARALAEDGLASPCDGKLQSFDVIESDRLFQAKGVEYSLNSLMGSADASRKYEGGLAITIYLAPHNYHRVHVPDQLNLQRSKKIAGDLWPVNRSSVENIHPLFCLNERWIMEGRVEDIGQMSLVMVGATNVGNMELFHLSDADNKNSKSDLLHSPEVALKRGEELGVFHMGSTVILILDRNLCDHYKMSLECRTLTCGEKLG